MNRDDDQQLWDLLGKTAEPQVSPFFARNVLRELRAEKRSSVPWFTWLSLRKLGTVAAGITAVVLAAVVLHAPIKPTHDSKSPVVANIDLDDSDIAADVDDLVAGGDDDNVADDSAIL
jgi:hypothetical protein